MNVNQYMVYQLELLKQLTINGQTLPAVKFELNLPNGCPFDDAITVCDDFKIVLQGMKDRHIEAQAAKESQADAPTTPIEPEIVA